jgi:hypothetical protein
MYYCILELEAVNILSTRLDPWLLYQHFKSQKKFLVAKPFTLLSFDVEFPCSLFDIHHIELYFKQEMQILIVTSLFYTI